MISIIFKIVNRLEKIYWFIFRPKTQGAKVIIECEDEILMIQNTYGKNVWAFPGGGIKKYEKPEETAQREVKEEVGIDISQLKYIGKILNTREYKRDEVFCYITSVGNKHVSADTREVKQAQWFNKQQIPHNISSVAHEVLNLWNTTTRMKTLRFAENLIPLILSGEKTSTWRLFDDKNLQIGDNLKFTHNSGEEFAQAKIIGIREKSFKEIEDNDFIGHEKFKSYEQMIETYKLYYGDSINDDTIVKMIDFKVI